MEEQLACLEVYIYILIINIFYIELLVYNNVNLLYKNYFKVN
jgi:hypothetical protein